MNAFDRILDIVNADRPNAPAVLMFDFVPPSGTSFTTHLGKLGELLVELADAALVEGKPMRTIIVSPVLATLMARQERFEPDSVRGRSWIGRWRGYLVFVNPRFLARRGCFLTDTNEVCALINVMNLE